MDYRVIVERTEHIAFVVTADSPEQAKARWAMDGEEVDADTVETFVLSVEEVK